MPAFGIRAIVLAVAVLMFLLARFGDAEDAGDWISLGLAVFALAFLIDALGMDRRVGGGPGAGPRV